MDHVRTNLSYPNSIPDILVDTDRQGNPRQQRMASSKIIGE
jgi:hypothetical protein